MSWDIAMSALWKWTKRSVYTLGVLASALQVVGYLNGAAITHRWHMVLAAAYLGWMLARGIEALGHNEKRKARKQQAQPSKVEWPRAGK